MNINDRKKWRKVEEELREAEKIIFTEEILQESYKSDLLKIKEKIAKGREINKTSGIQTIRDEIKRTIEKYNLLTNIFILDDLLKPFYSPYSLSLRRSLLGLSNHELRRISRDLIEAVKVISSGENYYSIQIRFNKEKDKLQIYLTETEIPYDNKILTPLKQYIGLSGQR